MVRLIGFLVGSAASIGMILVILGVPDINLSQQPVGDENKESASQNVEELTTDLETIADERVDEITNEVIAEVTEEIAELTDEVPSSELSVAESPIESDIDEPTANDLKWYAFWNPFRSRIAADGFVGQLEKVTGLDYRVVKIKTGVYEVTFGYEDDAELSSKLSLIASAAGLDLPES